MPDAKQVEGIENSAWVWETAFGQLTIRSSMSVVMGTEGP